MQFLGCQAFHFVQAQNDDHGSNAWLMLLSASFSHARLGLMQMHMLIP
jgi:hypothetical protein